MQRRDLFAWLAGAVLERLSASAARAAASFPWAGLPESTEVRSEFRYRVDATILLLGVPVIRRTGAGEARMSMRQARSAADRRIAVEFAVSSDPARAHGLNRLGWIRELVLEQFSAVRSATVLGIMSDSPEQSAADASKAFSGPGQARFVAIDSLHEPGETRSRVASFARPGPPSLNAAMADAARASLAECRSPWRHTARHGVAAPFLYAVLRALETGQASSEARYVYNEDEYCLRLQRSPDGTAGDRVRGSLQNAAKRLRPVQFQFWVERGAEASLPARIEFQPRSFLKLRLERVGAGHSDPPSGQTAGKERA